MRREVRPKVLLAQMPVHLFGQGDQALWRVRRAVDRQTNRFQVLLGPLPDKALGTATSARPRSDGWTALNFAVGTLAKPLRSLRGPASRAFGADRGAGLVPGDFSGLGGLCASLFHVAASRQSAALFAAASEIDPKALYQFVLIVSLLVSMGAGVASVAAFFNSRRTQRREITFVREMASRDDLMHMRKDIDRIEAEVGKVRAEQKEERLLSMAAAEARQKETLSRISRLDEVLGNMRERVPR